MALTLKSIPLAGVAAAIALASPSAFALACGDVLYQSVTLSGDVVCAPDEYGLVIGADGVRVNLNGFTISGSAASTAWTVGVTSVGFREVEIVGPGRIRDFTFSIMITEGVKHRVSDLVALGGGVALTNAGESVIERNKLPHVAIKSAPGGTAFYNRIENNEFFPAPPPYRLRANMINTPPIEIAGCGVEKNLVTGNTMAPPPPNLGPGHSVMVYANASNNTIIRNTFTRGVYFGSASGNQLFKNVIAVDSQSPYAGVEIEANRNYCPGPAWIGSSQNDVRGNEITDGSYGVAVHSLPGASSHGNVIRDNRIDRARTGGLGFSRGSDNNDGRQNRVNAPVYAVDLGTGNLWP